MGFHFWELALFGVYPPPWSSGIIELAENRKQNIQNQRLADKILSRKDLGPIAKCCFYRFRLGYDLAF